METSSYVTDWLEKRARLTPDRVGLIDAATGRDIRYAEWNAAANRTANLLRDLGVERGDRVSVYANNCVEYLDILFACGKIGAILHNINWRLTVFEIGQIIADATPRVLLYSPAWRDAVAALRPQLAAANTRIVAMAGPAPQGDGDGDDRERAPDERLLAERDQYPAELIADADLDMDHPWAIFYTGGTTGLPKGAVLTHGNMTWNSVNTITSWGMHADHAAPLQLPLFHVGGPNIFMLPLVHVGGTTVLCREFDIEQTFDLIAGGQITHFVGVPTMYIMMQQHPRWRTADFSRLELVISGGAPCPLPVMEKFWDKGIDFKMGYGLTEAAGNNFWLPPGDVRNKPGSVGFPIFHIDMKIVDEHGHECAADQPGELLIRGPHVMAGYWQKPEATAEVIKHGWLHTGDLARRDSDGYFTIIGRSKDMFISGGENVYPAEIESVMHAHPAVAEAALIGVAHEKWGEVGRAFVVVEHGHSLEPGELLAFLGQRLARYKLPREIVFVDALPRTVVGKIDKKRLAAQPVPGPDASAKAGSDSPEGTP